MIRVWQELEWSNLLGKNLSNGQQPNRQEEIMETMQSPGNMKEGRKE
jgi:hypothetical protein